MADLRSGLIPLALLSLGLVTAAIRSAPALAVGEAEASTLSGQLISINAQTLTLADAAGKRTEHALTSLRRFGEPGAAIAEFQPGEQVHLTRQGDTVTIVRDAISLQLERKQPFRVISQDRAQYRFTVEPVASATGAPAGAPETLGYGRLTFLVTRENPSFVFGVVAGALLWINRGAGPEGKEVMAREVLDEASRQRFARQQRLRALARFDTAGAPARVTATGPELTVQLSADAETWARRLMMGERVRISGRATPDSASILVAAAPTGTPPALKLRGELAGLQRGDYVRITPLREQVSFDRDIEPILQVNCLPCHGGRGASGFTISDPDRMRAGGPRGPGIVPGKSTESLLYLTMSGGRNPRMPPDRDVTREQLQLIQRWIDSGAPFPAKPR